LDVKIKFCSVKRQSYQKATILNTRHMNYFYGAYMLLLYILEIHSFSPHSLSLHLHQWFSTQQEMTSNHLNQVKHENKLKIIIILIHPSTTVFILKIQGVPTVLKNPIY